MTEVVETYGIGFDIGTWYQSDITGFWYRRRELVCVLRAIRTNGKTEPVSNSRGQYPEGRSWHNKKKA